MSIGKINHFFEKLLKCDKLNDDAGVELCLKILKILVKKHHLLIWLPRESGEIIFDELHAGKEYYATFRSDIGADFLITMGLAKSSDYIRYEFEIGLLGSRYLSVELGHIIHRVESGEKARTVVMVRGKELPSEYGHLIVELYNKIANQLLTVVELNKVKKALAEILEGLKIK